jgi:mono/diheme cytochrome c family protein
MGNCVYPFGRSPRTLPDVPNAKRHLMKTVLRVLPLVLVPVVTALAVTACAVQGGMRRPETGAQIFAASCAACHGVDAHGNGPVSPFLNVRVPDLTAITVRHGGEFPSDQIYQFVDGQGQEHPDETRHMPIWGYEFYGDSDDDEVAHRQASEKIDRVVAYLKSLQHSE